MAKRHTLLLTALLVAALSCSDENDDAVRGELSAIDLTVGSENRYLYVVTEDSAGVLKETYRDTFAVRVEANGQSVGEHTDLIRLRAYEVGADSMYSQSWYSQTPQELVDQAYRHAGGTPVIIPKRDAQLLTAMSAPAQFGLQMLSGRFGPAGDTTVRTDRRIVYQYPLSAGRSWTSFSDPFASSRTVTGTKSVAVPAGMYDCTVIRTTIPSLAPTLEWLDFVSEQGLIVRTLSDSLMITTEDSPEGTGFKKKITFDLRLLRRVQ